MDIWSVLGIDETTDIRQIKSAYAKKTRIFHPETHPDEFQTLRRAYEAARQYAGKNEKLWQNLPGNPDSLIQDTAFFFEAERSYKPVASPARERDQYDELIDEVEINRKQNQEDLSAAPLLEFEKLLHDETKYYYPEHWKKYFSDSRFLDYQYHEGFISRITETMEKDLRGENPWEDGYLPQYVFIYLIIVYGCMFSRVSARDTVTEDVYRSELLTGMSRVLRLTPDLYSKYLLIEMREDLLGERYAFYLYRCILAELEQDEPDGEKLKSLLVDGFREENESHLLEIMHVRDDGCNNPERKKYYRKQGKLPRDSVFFCLMEYLAEKNSTSEVFKNALREVCRMDWQMGECEERDILVMMYREGNYSEQAESLADEAVKT